MPIVVFVIVKYNRNYKSPFGSCKIGGLLDILLLCQKPYGKAYRTLFVSSSSVSSGLAHKSLLIMG